MFSKLFFTILFISTHFFFLTNGDITSMLAKDQTFSTFNNYLTSTQVASRVSDQVSTVFVVENGAMQQLSGQTNDTIQKVMLLHVAVGYFDEAKIKAMNGSQGLNTLAGNLNVTHSGSGSVTFVSGSTTASFIKEVDSVNGSISIVQVSNIMLPQGTTLKSNASGPSPSTNSSTAQSPKSNSTAHSPPSSKSNSTSSSPSSSPPGPPGKDKSHSPGSSPSDGGSSSDGSGSAPAPSGSGSEKFGFSFSSVMVVLMFVSWSLIA